MFWVILSGFLIFALAWWWWADRTLRPLRRARLWRSLLVLFMATELIGFFVLFVARALGWRMPIPTPLLASIYIWHLIILPPAVVLTIFGESIHGLVKGVKRLRTKGAPAPDSAPPAPAPELPTRRHVLAATAAALPPLVTVGAVGVAMERLPRFRVRHLTVELPNLPPALEGLRIAHVSDTHVGRLTRGGKLDAIVERTNALDPDLVLMTGDLIDFEIADLPVAIDMARGFRSKYGFYLCEGNHDLIVDRAYFEKTVLDAGLPLLLNEAASVTVKGQEVQVLGIPWGRGSGMHARRDARINDHVETVAKLVRPGAFPILLAHHPHAFDAAAEAGIPLTLAGHTHGGQLMLTRNIGPGPWMYRYWSGLYQKPNASLVVSNGVGNWLPLRINAPAEIIDITLKRSVS